jgi:hypothetical protein
MNQTSKDNLGHTMVEANHLQQLYSTISLKTYAVNEIKQCSQYDQNRYTANVQTKRQ